ncbi:hypothetical protein ABIB62_004338 [Mucilaginibacter sp. UYP25]|uniref:TIR domain-containing protein n=1 Tax=unclassified Mucilaginibacter TaxID=2617802 RepID=UPI003393A6D3
MANQRVPGSNSDDVSKLIKDKASFKEELLERIKLGSDLFNKSVDTTSVLDLLNKEYYDWNDYNAELIKTSFRPAKSEYLGSYASCTEIFFYTRLNSRQEELDSLKKDIATKINNLERLVNKLPLIGSLVNESNTIKVEISQQQNDNIFIVHGHDITAETKAARFIEQIGFKPIILHEQSSSGKTIIEKIEEYSNVGFGIVLYTPCDTGVTLP